MSTNIHFHAVRDIIVKTGKQTTQEIIFEDVWRTSTHVTMEIIKGDPIQAYKDYIISQSEDQELPVYDENDIFCEYDPVGVDIYNAGKEHLAQFEEWLKMCDEEGFTVTAEAW